MAMQATIRKHRRYVQWTATQAYLPGEIVQVPDGRAGVIAGTKGVAAGEEVVADTEVVAEVLSASATTFADGAAVQWDNTNKLAVATGDFALGKANGAKIAGQTVVRVAFNV